MSYLVLLKNGHFTIVECRAREIFELARELDAGICGVFEDRAPAEALIARESQSLPR